MFKNATILGISPKAKIDVEQLQAARFVPIGDLEAQSAGFSPVRGDELAYVSAGSILLNYTVEKKVMPASAVNVIVKAKADELGEAQGFPLGKKAMKELKERVIDELLPRALSTRRTTAIWVDAVKSRIVVDSPSSSVVTDIQRALIKTLGDIGLQDVAWPRAKVITEWMIDEPAGFTLDDQVALKYPGEKGTVVKITNVTLPYGNVTDYINAGAMVESMSMTYDDRISFVMTEDAQLRRIRPLDVLKQSAAEAEEVDKFEANFALMTLEFRRMIDALVGEA